MLFKSSSSFLTAFKSLLGFRGDYDPQETQLSNYSTTESGYYFEDFHPMITIQNIRSIAPDFEDFTYPTHDSKTEYQSGDLVTDGTDIYRAILPVPVDTLITDDSYWEIVDPFSLWLDDQVERSIQKLIDTWFKKKLERSSVKAMLSKREAVSIIGDEDTLVDNVAGHKVGLRVIPLIRGVKLRIRRIGVHLNNLKNSLLITVRDSNNNTVTTALTGQSLGNGGLTWFDLSGLDTWVFEYGKVYNITYDQDDLASVKAINALQYKNGIKVFQTTKRYDVYGIDADGDVSDANIVFNNFGLNLDIEAYCDYTDFIVQQKDVFARALGFQFAVDMLSQMLYNPHARINRNKRNIEYSQQVIRYELDGDSTSMKKSGLKHELDKAIELVAFDQDAINEDCLNCRKKGIRYTTM